MVNSVIELAKDTARIDDEKHLVEAEKILLDYLKEHKDDSDSWLLLARIEWNSPLEDPDRILEYLDSIFTRDPTHPYALLFLAQTYHTFLGGINDDIFTQLCHICSPDQEVMAMVEVAKARYFKHRDTIKYQEALECSVKYSRKQQINCSSLGILYCQQGDLKKGRALVKQAVENIKAVDAKWDEVSIEYWFNYYYKGTEISQWMYDDLLKLLEQASGSI